MSLVILFWGEVGKFCSPRVVPRERVRSPKFESRRGKLLRDGCACAARVNLGMRNVRRVNLTDFWSWYRVELRVGDHLGRSEELVSRCIECDLAEPESLASLGGSAPGVVDGILSVETATYGSEFVAARTAVDQIIDIHTTLRYLGVPIRDKSYMFGDNRSVVTSSTIPNSPISKRHHLASYH